MAKLLSQNEIERINAVEKYAGDVFASLLENRAYIAVKYISPTLVLRVTRRLFDRKIPANSNIEAVVTVGRPNYLERDVIKGCKKAGEKFPVRNIILKFPPQPKKKK